MKKLSTFILGMLFCTLVMAQAPEGVVKKASVAPVVDGKMDPVWFSANTYNIAVPFKSETPTLGDVGTTTWKALWTDEGIYILLKVNDDQWNPSYISGGASHMFDKPEIYFDVNAVKKDGKGAKDGAGHYQVAPEAFVDFIDGTPKTDASGIINSFLVTEPTYMAEYFIPFTKFKDAAGADVDLTAPIGFDVTLIDSDEGVSGRQRMDWANAGAIDESWNNMDDAGTITLSQELAEPATMVMKASTAPVIDGIVEEVWASSNVYNIAVKFQEEEPTVGDLGQTTWKALHNADGMFILVQVTDDEWLPSWAVVPAGNSYEYDQLEVYFDCNEVKKDGVGGQDKPNGHLQIAPASAADKIDGGLQVGTRLGLEYNYSYKVTGSNWLCELFVPWEMIKDADGNLFDTNTQMGFDITVIDRDTGDAARKRMNWANAGAINESWNNMDDAGLISFDGAIAVVPVEKVTVSGGTAITTDNGTIQMVAAILPDDATTKKVKWTVENLSGKATISKEGLLTAVKNGTVKVTAISIDGTLIENSVTVTISGQILTLLEINYLKNGNFDNVTATGGPVDWSNGTVEDGVVTFGPAEVMGSPWDYKMAQNTNVPFALKDEDFILSFKAWADEPRTLPLVFEDSFDDGNLWDAYASSTDLGWEGKTWTVDLTTEPTVYTLNFNFSPMQETTIQAFNFQVGMAAAPIHMDNIYLVRKADLALVSARSLANAASKVQLYPNPVQKELTVSRIAVANSKVSVYNAVGQKLMDRTANGTQAKFDVSSLRKGMYFVRFSDGTSEKFIKQ